MNDPELELALGDLPDLFTAPALDPLSSSPARMLGISGVEYLLKLLINEPRRRSAQTLRLLVPPERVNPAQVEPTNRALHHLAEFRIAEERRELRHTYRDGWRVFGIALVFLAVCLAISSFFASESLENWRPHLRRTLEYSFEIIGWVMLWHPIELLILAPRTIRARIHALRTLSRVFVSIEPDAHWTKVQ